jgi:hypothetical protein
VVAVARDLLGKLPGLQKKGRVAIDWMLDLVFARDIVELPTLRSPTISTDEESAAETTTQRKVR